MSGAYLPVRAKTHLQYARRLFEEAITAERRGNSVETAQKCLEAAEHAIKCLFNVTGVDFQEYKNMQEAISRGLRGVLDKEIHIRMEKDYSDLKTLSLDKFSVSDFVQKASLMIQTAAELTKGIWE